MRLGSFKQKQDNDPRCVVQWKYKYKTRYGTRRGEKLKQGIKPGYAYRKFQNLERQKLQETMIKR